MHRVLYVNHKPQQCGVYEYGKEIGNLLIESKKFKAYYCECDSLDDLSTHYKKIKPEVIIYNYHPTTMPWVINTKKFAVPILYRFQAVQVGTIHEVYQQVADEANNMVFDFHVAPDPTLILKNPLVYKTGRLLPAKAREVTNINDIPVIGSFGFATGGKGFEKIISMVQNEFDHAVIKLNIPFAKFGDTDGIQAREIAAACNALVYKNKIDLQINHSYLEKQELLSFLSTNSMNVFLYDDMKNRGISSATDWALASGRPLAISRSRLFRHLFNCKPSICIDDNSLKSILANGVKPLKQLWSEFSPEIVLWDYERMIEDIVKKKSRKITSNRTAVRFFLNKVLRKFGIPVLQEQIIQNTWTKVGDKFEFCEHSKFTPDYKQVILQPGESLNRILDDSARNTYKSAINFMCKYFPVLIAKKIPEANVQQAFVLDTVVRLCKQFDRPRILAVGSFEDTAVEALKLLNYHIEDIDPVLNYDLGTFLTRPDIEPRSFDIVFSTSVIEHVEDDERFVKDIASLLKKGGFAILTCDYKDQYVKGDDIPIVDYRFYTQGDIKNRLMRAIPDCELIDEAKWDCDKPDFYYLNRYNYTFASIVFMKSKSS